MRAGVLLVLLKKRSLDHDCGVVDPAPSEVSFRTGLSGSDATSTPTPRTWGRKIQGKPGLETTSSSIKIALTNKLLDEQTNGNATLEVRGPGRVGLVDECEWCFFSL